MHMYNMSEACCNINVVRLQLVSVGESRGCTLMVRDIIMQQPSQVPSKYINTYKCIVHFTGGWYSADTAEYNMTSTISSSELIMNMHWPKPASISPTQRQTFNITLLINKAMTFHACVHIVQHNHVCLVQPRWDSHQCDACKSQWILL